MNGSTAGAAGVAVWLAGWLFLILCSFFFFSFICLFICFVDSFACVYLGCRLRILVCERGERGCWLREVFCFALLCLVQEEWLIGWAWMLI